MKTLQICALLLAGAFVLKAQEPLPVEKRVPLSEAAVALDSTGAPALEATLRTTALNGAADSPVSNIRMVVRNASSANYAFVSGLVTFYDGGGVRCGEGLFKADALAIGEAFETDTPGIRIRCSPATWRLVATNLLPRVAPDPPSGPTATRVNTNLIISVDGEEHPIQLEKPMVLSFGNAQRTIVIREAP